MGGQVRVVVRVREVSSLLPARCVNLHYYGTGDSGGGGSVVSGSPYLALSCSPAFLSLSLSVFYVQFTYACD